MKKLLSVLLISVMALSLLAGCGSKEGGDKEAKGEVYYLNFKPEADQAWQALAKTYTKETGVKVTVHTAASGEYEATLSAEIETAISLDSGSSTPASSLAQPIAATASAAKYKIFFIIYYFTS